MHFDFTIGFSSIFSLGTLIAVLKIYRAWVVTQEQHGMMWRDYKRRHGINGNWRQHSDFIPGDRAH